MLDHKFAGRSHIGPTDFFLDAYQTVVAIATVRFLASFRAHGIAGLSLGPGKRALLGLVVMVVVGRWGIHGGVGSTANGGMNGKEEREKRQNRV